MFECLLYTRGLLGPFPFGAVCRHSFSGASAQQQRPSSRFPTAGSALDPRPHPPVDMLALELTVRLFTAGRGTPGILIAPSRVVCPDPAPPLQAPSLAGVLHVDVKPWLWAAGQHKLAQRCDHSKARPRHSIMLRMASPQR